MIALLVICSVTAFAQEGSKIVSVNVVGNERIDKAFITNSIKAKEGDGYDLEKLREDMKSIYKTGFFSDVQIDAKDVNAQGARRGLHVEPVVYAVPLEMSRLVCLLEESDIRTAGATQRQA